MDMDSDDEDLERARRRELPPSYIATAGVNPVADELPLAYDDPLYTCTKSGGLRPFMNPESMWPVCKNCMRPLVFVWQMNMDDPQVPLPIRQRLAGGGGTGIFQLFWWWVLAYVWKIMARAN